MKTYSHSALSLFETCPLQYRFKYIDRLKGLPKSIEAFMGIRVHEVMERLYRDVMMTKIPVLEELLEHYESSWEREWSDEIRIVKQEYSPEHYRELGRRAIRGYYARHAPFDEDRTLGLEKRIGVALADGNKCRITGFIDRLVEAKDGTCEIHDYKTSGSLPDQVTVDRDRQLALYQIAVQESFPAVEKARLVWHYLLFDKIFHSSRTPEELEALRTRTCALIRTIEACREFAPRESALCAWCDYAQLCPLKKHLVKVAQLGPEEFRADDGVALVNEYARRYHEKKRLEIELERLKAEIREYCRRHAVEVLAGSGYAVRVSEQTRLTFPRRVKDKREYGELCALLKKAGRWEKVSELSSRLLRQACDSGELEEEVRREVERFQRENTTVSLTLRGVNHDD